MNTITQPVRSEPLHKQIESRIRSLIADGTYRPGDKLPSNQELAKLMGSSTIPVQTALQRLCREGLLERKTRVGTFVTGGGKKLTAVGMYLCGDTLWQNMEAGFYQVLCRELVRLFAKEGAEVQVFTDARRDLTRSTPLPALRRAVARGKVQAVVSPVFKGGAVQWLRDLGVPVAMLNFSQSLSKIKVDDFYALREIMKILREQGCRTVGLIANVNPKEDDRFYPGFIAAADEVGLEFRDEWICCPREYRENGLYNAAGERVTLGQFGYEKFVELWKNPTRPDGLIVGPDTVAHGMLQAMRLSRVEPPRDLKLALYANKQMPYPCPEPHVKAVLDIEDIAAAMIKIVRAQFDNEPLREIVISQHIERAGERYFDQIKTQ